MKDRSQIRKNGRLAAPKSFLLLLYSMALVSACERTTSDELQANEKPISVEDAAETGTQDSWIEPEDSEHSFSGEWQILDGYRKVCDGYLTRSGGDDYCQKEIPADWLSFEFEGKTYYLQPLSGGKSDENE
ncbi:MAG: hypothetical protein O7D88_07640 [Gammaproteobacteria bacterium]|nr:hypothetical protein [Gammaproteobacteria bacterium]